MSNPAPVAPGIELSVLIPMYNEADNLSALFAALLPVLDRLGLRYEVVCVDDGSRDGTFEVLRARHAANPVIKALALSRNFGKDTALTAGLRHCRGAAVVPIDADLQHPPELIETFVAKWREGYEVVYAVRTDRADESWLKREASNAFYRLFRRMSEIPIPADAGDFRLLDRRVVDVLNRMPERGRFMKGLFAWVGFRQIGVPYTPQERHAGSSKWNFWRLWNFAIDGLTAFSTVPLRVWTYFGVLVAVLSFLYGLYLLVRTLVFGVDVPGFASIMVSLLFLGGVQLMSSGILGEYLGRVYNEVKARPLFVVRDCVGIEPEGP